MELAAADAQTKLIVLYVEPGGLYEQIAVRWMEQNNFAKPIIVYVGGIAADDRNLSLGHAGAVVEGRGTSARDKMSLFDEYLGVEPFRPGMIFKKGKPPVRGLRIQTLHDLPAAAQTLYDNLGMERDSRQFTQLRLNPWLKNMGSLGKRLPPHLVLGDGHIPSPYREQILEFHKTQFGKLPARRDMRNASYASSNDGATPRVYGHNVIKLMEADSFAHSLILGWTGYPPSRDFETALVEQSLIAAMTNGPGTISAQAAKLSASAGNEPHVSMIATLSTIGAVHGGNGQQAAAFMIDAFANTQLADPYDAAKKPFVQQTARAVSERLLKQKLASREQDIAFERVPCMGHPVYRNEEVNYDPRERVIWHYLEQKGIYHAFFHFYHELAAAMRQMGITRNVLAVNVDAAIACTWLGVCWPLLCDKKMTIDRAKRIPVLAFALGRAAGGASEYLDHSDFGQPMDMRIPVAECNALTPPKD